MKLELRNISFYKRISEETPAFAARLYVDGAFAADISNDGHGGCDRTYWFSREVEAKVSAHFLAMPKVTTDGFEYQPDLESWAHTEVWLREDLKSIKRKLAKSVSILTTDGREISFPKIAPTQLPVYRERITAKFPGAVVLNEQNDEFLIERLRAA